MLHTIPGGNDPLAFRAQPAHGHRRAVVIAEEQGQAFREAALGHRRVLLLVVDMDVRFAGPPRVSTAAEHRALFDLLSRLDLHAALLQMGEHQEGPALQLE